MRRDSFVPQDTRGWCGGIGGLHLLYVIVWTLIDDPDNQLSRERRLCDQEVAVLLNSQDLIELTRAASITSQLECSIGRRLPKTYSTGGQEIDR
jgi:hypothetical protein